jgi:hypothetical protein
MQPPSRTPTPNSATNNPLAAISSSFPDVSPGDRIKTIRPQLTEKSAPLPRFPAFPQQLAAICCTNAALDFRRPRRARLAAQPSLKNDFADNTLREGLP